MAAAERYDESILDFRRRTLSLVLLAAMILLAGRLLYMQTVRHGYYNRLAFSNQMTRERLLAPRGVIRARDGTKLVVNMPVYQIEILPNRCARKGPLIAQASAWLGLDSTAVAASLAAWTKRYTDGREMVVVQAADKRQISILRENRELISFFRLTMHPRRFYPDTLLASHLLGYVGEVTDEECAASDSLTRGDVVGRTGLELRYERYLRGEDGVRIVGVSTEGLPIGEIRGIVEDDDLEKYGGARPAIPGNDLYLTLDVAVQHAAERAFTGARGAVVVMDPRTGAILAAVSRPTYDPNMFIEGVSDSLWLRLNNDPAKPLYNRVVQAMYPPGSTFKIVTTYAALTNHVITGREYLSSCYGGYRFGNRYFRCWQERGHGALLLRGAITQSCDTYFYQVGMRLTVDQFAAAGRLFGLGARTGIDLPSEAEGIIPDTPYLDKQYGKGRWARGNLLNFAIGQGEVLATPVQLCEVVSFVANGGRRIHPHVVSRIVEPGGEIVYEHPATADPVPGADPSVLVTIRDALEDVVSSDWGTGRAASVRGVRVGGKTGTAQNPHGEDHALFVALAPVENPEICCAIIVENAGHGGSKAAPIAREIFTAYFGLGGARGGAAAPAAAGRTR